MFFKKVQQVIGGTATPTVSQKNLGSCTVAIPQPHTQQAIVEKLDALSEETKALEAIYERKQSALAELKQSLLQKAFAGELWVKDEGGKGGLIDFSPRHVDEM